MMVEEAYGVLSFVSLCVGQMSKQITLMFYAGHQVTGIM